MGDGWTPIGKGGRKGNKGFAFSGTFDGNNHTIFNLNNEGYNPPTDAIYADTYGAGEDKAYAYGLFGLTKNATIYNLTLTDVNIDTSSANMTGDSVAALVGYAIDGLTIKNVTVNGTIKAVDAVAGIVGRAYKLDTANAATVSVEGCANNATITVLGTDGGSKCAGIVGYVNNDQAASGKYSKQATDYIVNIKDNTNNGTVTGDTYIAGVVVFGGGSATYNISGNKTNNCKIYYGFGFNDDTNVVSNLQKND